MVFFLSKASDILIFTSYIFISIFIAPSVPQHCAVFVFYWCRDLYMHTIIFHLIARCIYIDCILCILQSKKIIYACAVSLCVCVFFASKCLSLRKARNKKQTNKHTQRFKEDNLNLWFFKKNILHPNQENLNKMSKLKKTTTKYRLTLNHAFVIKIAQLCYCIQNKIQTYSS